MLSHDILVVLFVIFGGSTGCIGGTVIFCIPKEINLIMEEDVLYWLSAPE